MRIVTTMLFIVLGLMAGSFVLQIFLSKRTSKWPGLILPAITFLYSVVMILNVAALEGMSGNEIFINITSTFLLSNIPTIIFIGIYLVCREKMKVRSQIDKMNIQDLN